jgi:hypothetical protein
MKSIKLIKFFKFWSKLGFVVIYMFFINCKNANSQVFVNVGYTKLSPYTLFPIWMYEWERIFCGFCTNTEGYLYRNKFKGLYNINVSYNFSVLKNNRLFISPDLTFSRLSSYERKINASKYTLMLLGMYNVIKIKNKVNFYLGCGLGGGFIFYKTFRDFEYQKSFIHSNYSLGLNFAMGYVISPRFELLIRLNHEFCFILSQKYIYWYSYYRENSFNNFNIGLKYNLRPLQGN